LSVTHQVDNKETNHRKATDRQTDRQRARERDRRHTSKLIRAHFKLISSSKPTNTQTNLTI